MKSLTFAQQKALIYFRDGDVPNRRGSDGGMVRTPGARVRKNLAEIGLIEPIPNAPRKCWQLTDAGKSAVQL